MGPWVRGRKPVRNCEVVSALSADSHHPLLSSMRIQSLFRLNQSTYPVRDIHGIYLFIYIYIYTARTDVLPRKVRFDCAGPMFCEIPRVVRLGKRMTIFSLVSSTTSSSSSSSSSQLNVKFNGGGSLIFPNTYVKFKGGGSLIFPNTFVDLPN